MSTAVSNISTAVSDMSTAITGSVSWYSTPPSETDVEIADSIKNTQISEITETLSCHYQLVNSVDIHTPMIECLVGEGCEKVARIDSKVVRSDFGKERELQLFARMSYSTNLTSWILWKDMQTRRSKMSAKQQYKLKGFCKHNLLLSKNWTIPIFNLWQN
ncbi:hypothetical protein OESDEN_09171 [Oesophagostomum dentatum]|uniref:Uncharacterized protein n=1 Tax=Oesophagostomum dentatum TaxID=61180 RepID=A0A0B1T5A5_OESDE|nr:hypothetical protein OESDEN_09171 [Oesophagostomum dentatum]